MSRAQEFDQHTLPKAGTTRRCPNCTAGPALIKRWPQANGIWQVSCSRCGHIWQERTGRSVIDTILESRQRAVAVGALLMVAASVAAFAGYVAWLFLRAADMGRPGTEGLALIFIAALAFIVGAAYVWRHSINSDPSLRQ